MKKNLLLISSLLGLSFFFGSQALAICPVCVVAVGAGVGLSRYFGVDDVLTGIWVGGLLFSVSIWTIDWLAKKKWNFRFNEVLVFATYYLLTVAPLYYNELIGHPFNKLWGMDKLVLGIIIGTIGIFAGSNFYNFLKKKNNNRAHFPFEKVVMPVSLLIILNIIFYFITKY